MGKIKKILENELVGGTQTTDVYPVTSTKAVYDTDNKVLDEYIQHLKKTSTFAGIATPTTNPGTPDGPVFYIANGKGTYTNFGGINVTEDEVVILYYDTVWHKEATGIASNDKLTELEEDFYGKNNDIKVAISTTSATYMRPTIHKAEVDIRAGVYQLSCINEIFDSCTFYFYDEYGNPVKVRGKIGAEGTTIGSNNINENYNPFTFSSDVKSIGIYADNKKKDGDVILIFPQPKSEGLKDAVENNSESIKEMIPTVIAVNNALANVDSNVTTINPVVTWEKGLIGTDGVPRTTEAYLNYDYCSEFPVKEGDIIRANFRAFATKRTDGTWGTPGSYFYTDKEFVVPAGVTHMRVTVMLGHKRVLIVRKENNTQQIIAKRKEIYISLADSEEDIYLKLVKAIQQRDTDVYWEAGTYTFSEIYNLMEEKYGQRQCELPVGGNCRYFFNGSTIKAIVNVEDFSSINLMGSMRMDSSFELHDGYLYAEGTRYVFHDETSGSPYQYRRLYKNMHFSRKWARPSESGVLEKIIGGGMGQWGIVEFDGCTFKADSRAKAFLTYHGYSGTPAEKETNFMCIIHDCFVDGGISFDALASTQHCHIVINNTRYTALGYRNGEDRYIVDAYCNEIVE